MIKHDHFLVVGLTAGVLLSGLAGCNNVADDRIESICSCDNCPERDREIVTTRVDAAVDVADTYECSDQLDAYWTCELAKHECEGAVYQDDNQGECTRQFNQLVKCAQARSSADGDNFYGGDFFKHRR